MDTHRPKIKKAKSIRKLKEESIQLPNDIPVTNNNSPKKLVQPTLNTALVGASGEIVRDPMSPIIPISPQLYPKQSTSMSYPSNLSKTSVNQLDIGDSYFS